MAGKKNGEKNGEPSAGAAEPIHGNGPAKSTAANPAPGQPKSAKNPKPKINKMEAVRKALAFLGAETKPTEMQAYIKSTFGIDMSKDHISNYKGDILRKEFKDAAALAKPQATASAKKPAASESSTPATAPERAPASHPSRTADGSSILLEDVLTTKTLLDRVGADKLRTLIDGLAK